MKLLEPIDKADIPSGGGKNATRYAELYKQVLALDGLVLPVEFDDNREADAFKAQFYGGGKALKLGLGAARRGDTVYVYKKAP